MHNHINVTQHETEASICKQNSILRKSFWKHIISGFFPRALCAFELGLENITCFKVFTLPFRAFFGMSSDSWIVLNWDFFQIDPILSVLKYSRKEFAITSLVLRLHRKKFYGEMNKINVWISSDMKIGQSCRNG